jgi:hypothetical protein
MVMTLCDSKDLFYTQIISRGESISANYIVSVLNTILRHLRKKRPDDLAQQQWWWLHWDFAPQDTAASVKKWIVAHSIWMLQHPL